MVDKVLGACFPIHVVLGCGVGWNGYSHKIYSTAGAVAVSIAMTLALFVIQHFITQWDKILEEEKGPPPYEEEPDEEE